MAELLRLVSPVDKQVLLHPEALGAAVAVEAVVVSPQFGFGLVAVALALRQLGQLVLGGAERPRLLPDARRVNHQAVLWGGASVRTTASNEERTERRANGVVRACVRLLLCR